MRVATIPSDAGAEPFFALERGFFAKAGLDVRVDAQASGPVIAAAVAGGSLDIGFSNTVSIATAHKRGLPFAYVAPASVYVSAAPTSALMVRKESPLRVPRDLNGKTIGANALKNIAQYAPAAWLDRNGGDSTTLRFLEIPVDEMVPAMEQGRIDAGMLPEPQITESLPVCRMFAKPYDALGDGFMIAGWFASTAWADAHPDAVRRFAAAIRETAAWANRNPEQSLPVLVKYTKVDPRIASRVVRARFAESLTPAMLQSSVDLVARYKLIDTAFPAGELIYALK